MQAKLEKIFRLATCVGCPFVNDIAGDLLCKKYKNGEFACHIEDIGPETCDKLGQAFINQLKLSHPKVGLGFLIEPCEDDPGDATVILLGSIGIIFRSKLSEMFPNEQFAVFPSLRIFNEAGTDQTKIIREKALNKAIESSPPSVVDPYSGLLEEGTKSIQTVGNVKRDEEEEHRTYSVMDPDKFTRAIRAKALATTSERQDDGTQDLTTFLYHSRLTRLGRSSDWSIAFDFENFTCTKGEFKDNGGVLVGTQQIGDFVFLGCLAGGDWELPVFFIFYFSGEGFLRVYVPRKGNVFCSEHGCAYGSCIDHVDSPDKACPVDDHLNAMYGWRTLEADIKEAFDLSPETSEEE